MSTTSRSPGLDLAMRPGVREVLGELRGTDTALSLCELVTRVPCRCGGATILRALRRLAAETMIRRSDGGSLDNPPRQARLELTPKGCGFADAVGNLFQFMADLPTPTPDR